MTRACCLPACQFVLAGVVLPYCFCCESVKSSRSRILSLTRAIGLPPRANKSASLAASRTVVIEAIEHFCGVSNRSEMLGDRHVLPSWPQRKQSSDGRRKLPGTAHAPPRAPRAHRAGVSRTVLRDLISLTPGCLHLATEPIRPDALRSGGYRCRRATVVKPTGRAARCPGNFRDRRHASSVAAAAGRPGAGSPYLRPATGRGGTNPARQPCWQR